MALSEFDAKRCELLVTRFIEKRRPPPHLRAQVDLTFRLHNQSVEIFEVRPHWQDASKIIEHGVAKATYIKSRDTWKVLWQRADLKWHVYAPQAEVRSLDAFIALVDADAHACFFG